MKFSGYLFTIVLSICFVHMLAAQEKITSTIFPENNYYEGFLVKDSVRSFNDDKLYNLIEEESDLFFEFGFKEAMACEYENAEKIKFLLEVFCMTDPDAAYGIYTMKNSGKGKKVNYGSVATQFDFRIHFAKGPYYIRCTSSDNGKDQMKILGKYASYLDSAIIADGSRPKILNAFNSLGSKTYQEKYFRGQLGLDEIFSFGHGSIAGFNEGCSVREAEKYYFVFGYITERKRREWFAGAKGKVKTYEKFNDVKYVDDGFTALDKNGIYFSFKPAGNHILILRGYNWEDAKSVFEKMISNLKASE